MYSKELEKKRLDNTCARCEKRFPQWSDYHAHVTATVKCPLRIVPLKTSDRATGIIIDKISPVGTIVGDWERRQKIGAILV